MALISGKALQTRLNQYGLTDLYNLLHTIAAGQEDWPGSCIITPGDSQNIEYIRNLIYAALMELSIKPWFRIKVIPGPALQVDYTKPKISGLVFTSTPHKPDSGQSATTARTYMPGHKGDVLGDEGLIELFQETNPPWVQQARARREAAEGLGDETAAEQLLREQVEILQAKGLPFDHLLPGHLALEK